MSSFVARLSNTEQDLILPFLIVSYGTQRFIIKCSLNASISIYSQSETLCFFPDLLHIFLHILSVLYSSKVHSVRKVSGT